MQIRAFQPEDTDPVWSMLEPVFRAGDTYAIDPGISRDDALNYWTAHHAYVAEMDEALVGTANFFSAGFDAVFDVPARHPGSGSAFSAVIA